MTNFGEIPRSFERSSLSGPAFSLELTPTENVVISSNMTQRIDDLIELSPRAYVRLRVLEIPKPVRGSKHRFKYSLALVIDGVCVLRYDNEAGKGDHRHVKARGKSKLREGSYHFKDVETLQEDFWRDVEALWEP